MKEVIQYLQEFNLVSVTLRLLLSGLAGGIIGYGRSRQERAAGLRTYILISLGAASVMLLALFVYEMLNGPWSEIFGETGKKFDAARLAAPLIGGVGFIGGGIIIKARHQQVKGLTTSTGLFATAAMGLAAGAGFYECVLIAVLLIEIVLNLMAPLEVTFKRKLRNITLSVEYNSPGDIETIVQTILDENAKIFDIDVEQTRAKDEKLPSAIFTLQLAKENHSHSGMLSSIAELSCVNSVQELIS